MRKILRIAARVLAFVFVGVIVIVASLAALFGYFVYTPAPEVPQLSGALAAGAIDAGGYARTYLTYAPKGLPKGAPLVIVMHGSGGSGARIRMETGYAFERLADERGFALVYPDAYEGFWNACNIIGDYSANKFDVDDVGFLTGLADRLATEIGVDRARVFATGVSRGGSMAYRLALEAPSRFRAVAAVAASLPTPENFKCAPNVQGSPSIMIMNGVEDPLVPFNGGEVSFLGLMYKTGKVRSSRETGQYFADLNNIAGAPMTTETEMADGVRVEDVRWRGGSNVEVELVAIHGGGHGMPQPYRRPPRVLGPAPKEPNGSVMIWDFFDRQPRE